MPHVTHDGALLAQLQRAIYQLEDTLALIRAVMRVVAARSDERELSDDDLRYAQQQAQ